MNLQMNIPLIEAISANLRASMGDEFDAEAFWDTLDGEVSASDIMDRLIRAERDAAALGEAAKAQAAELSARASRFGAQCKAHRQAMLALLTATGERKVVRPGATVSRLAGRVSCKITDEDSIPTQLCEIVRKVDAAAVKAALQAGEVIPGAELVRGDDSVSVRVK